MNEEVKRVDLDWSDKINTYDDYVYAFERFTYIDKYLQECDEILNKVGLGIGFASQAQEIILLQEERSVLWNYVAWLQDFIDATIDEPLYKSFNHGATETISRIRLENFEVDNTLGLTVEYFVNGGGTGPVTIEKGCLTFEDFIGTLDGKADGNFLYTQFANGSIEEFAGIFRQQYQTLSGNGMLGKNGEMTLDEFLTQFYHQGEFDHSMDKPFESFVSSVLDILIFKPVIEACTGEEWFTGEDLSDTQRGLKAVFAMVDLFTLGTAMGGTKITELGAKEAVEYMGKTVLIEFGSNAAICGMGALGEKFNWPLPVTILLSLATGISVSCIGNKLLFTNAEGVVIRETVLEDGKAKIVGDMVEGESGTITASKDRLQHSVLGEFNSNGRLINGGHGQANIDYLNQNHIEYNIVKVYDNGVRVGNIPSHKNKFKRTGTGQAWFPESWTEINIKNAGEYVLNIPENINVPDGTWVFGEYNGVRVGVIKNDGKIGTIIPDNSRQP